MSERRIALRDELAVAIEANPFRVPEDPKQLGRAKLGVTATDRNWNTVTKLLEMADE